MGVAINIFFIMHIIPNKVISFPHHKYCTVPELLYFTDMKIYHKLLIFFSVSILTITSFFVQNTFAQNADTLDDAGGASDFYCPTLSVNMRFLARPNTMTDAKTNGQVTELQKFIKSYLQLTDQQFLVTGIFGGVTAKFVKQFQTENSLVSTGIVGAVTRAKIAELCSTAPSNSTTVDAAATYSWNVSSWGTCNNNIQSRSVVCLASNGNVVADSFCPGTKANTTTSCVSPNNNTNTTNSFNSVLSCYQPPTGCSWVGQTSTSCGTLSCQSTSPVTSTTSVVSPTVTTQTTTLVADPAYADAGSISVNSIKGGQLNLWGNINGICKYYSTFSINWGDGQTTSLTSNLGYSCTQANSTVYLNGVANHTFTSPGNYKVALLSGNNVVQVLPVTITTLSSSAAVAPLVRNLFYPEISAMTRSFDSYFGLSGRQMKINPTQSITITGPQTNLTIPMSKFSCTGDYYCQASLPGLTNYTDDDGIHAAPAGTFIMTIPDGAVLNTADSKPIMGLTTSFQLPYPYSSKCSGGTSTNPSGCTPSKYAPPSGTCNYNGQSWPVGQSTSMTEKYTYTDGVTYCRNFTLTCNTDLSLKFSNLTYSTCTQ
jgi:hypothetical protein